MRAEARRGGFLKGSGCIIASLCLLMTSTPANAQDLQSAARTLAAKIAAALPSGTPVALTLRDREGESDTSFRGAEIIRSELQRSGVQLAATGQEVVITASRNVRGNLFVAEAGKEIVVVEWNAAAPPARRPRFQLERAVIWIDASPILDLMSVSDGKLLALQTTRVVMLAQTAGAWRMESQAPLSLNAPMPRDPRGRLLAATDGIRAYLPGSTCGIAIEPSLKASCWLGEEPWTYEGRESRWTPRRNVIESAGADPYFTAATADGALFLNGPAGVFQVDGAEPEPVRGLDWGSDIATLRPACAASGVIVGASADNEERIQVFERADSSAVPASDPLALSGPVTALWPAEPADRVTLTIRQPQTGMYETSRVSAICTP